MFFRALQFLIEKCQNYIRQKGIEELLLAEKNAISTTIRKVKQKICELPNVKTT